MKESRKIWQKEYRDAMGDLIEALDKEREKQGITIYQFGRMVKSNGSWWHNILRSRAAMLDSFLKACDNLNIEITLTDADGNNIVW